MPWCDDCQKFANPPSMGPNGECPWCQRVIGEPAKVPWHLKLLFASVTIYLAFRGYQGVVWVIHHL